MYVVEPERRQRVVMDFATRKPIAKWQIRGGGGPDMGGVSVDGTTLWLSGLQPRRLRIRHAGRAGGGRVKVGKGPHGLAVFFRGPAAIRSDTTATFTDER